MNSKNILVPNLPESVVDAVVAVWHKQIGDHVKHGELLVELETDKIMLEVPSEESGTLIEISNNVGSIVTSGQILGKLTLYDASVNTNSMEQSTDINSISQNNHLDSFLKIDNDSIKNFSPSIRRLINEYHLQPELILKHDLFKQITRENIEKYLLHQYQDTPKSISSSIPVTTRNPRETRVPMTRLRKRIAERLLNVIHNTAMLTTFNEINMKPIINLRKQHGEYFEKKHEVRLGFMSFYVKAVVEALKTFPEINASIDGEEIVYHNYFDISIAVSTTRGLVTPVLRNVNLLNIHEIEKEIKLMAIKGREGKLNVEELSGGTFTITNGGVFGSLMSTPILNPPQSAILGMHAIKNRPMAVDDTIVILPMMYVALSYDHRLIDGKDSISFLVKIKEILEDPVRLLLNI